MGSLVGQTGHLIGQAGRPPRQPIHLLLAGLLGVACAVLVACGSSGKGLIPAASAGPLQGDFEAIAQAAQTGNGDCTATQEAIAKTEADFQTLPAGVNSGLRERLRTGIANLASRARALCTQPIPGVTTASVPTTTSTSSSLTTSSSSTTTSTSTSTPTSTAITPTTTGPPAPGGGTPAPGESGGTPGTGNGQGNGEGNGAGAGGAGVGNGQGNGEGNGQGGGR